MGDWLFPRRPPGDPAGAGGLDKIQRPPPSVAEAIRAFLATAEIIGRRTGELHMVLADSTHPAFAPEPLTKHDLKELAETMRERANVHLKLLEAVLPRLGDRNQRDAQEV